MSSKAPAIFLLLLALSQAGSRSPCEPLPPLTVEDHLLMGSASKEGKPLGSVQVSLYSAGKLIFESAANKKGEFTIDHLPLGSSRLRIDDLGNFNLQVVPPKTAQHAWYGFGTINGCRTFSIIMD